FVGTYYSEKRFFVTHNISVAHESPQLAFLKEAAMPKLRLTFVAIAALASATSALALKAQMNASEHEAETQTFRCGPAEAGQNPIVAADLQRTVIVNLILIRDKATDFKVSYIAETGQKSDPAAKTKPWLLVTMPSGHDYRWHAAGRRQPNLLMLGWLFERSGGREAEY